MKKIFFLILIFMMLAFTGGYLKSTSVVITPASELVINGETNVNSFKCEYDVLRLQKPISVAFKRINDKIVFDETVLVLDNSCFDCGGAAINADFQQLLKSDEHPEIQIRLKEITGNSKEGNQVNALLDLSISGVSKPYVMPLRLTGDRTLHVDGAMRLNIRDFNLKPPKKVLGLIVVKDTIEINFRLKIKEYGTY